MYMNKENKEGRNLEEINKKNVLNFGDLSLSQNARGMNISSVEARIKCQRCNERITVKWKNRDEGWEVGGGWKVYLRKSQVKKHDIGYYIVGGIEFYCSDCDWRHNYWEK